ncbi:MAG: hydrogenase nickel incorporation protein HypA [Planctomycetota bacterium]|nr:hydrogenase nickel incorporation protein HypA [Planctomycetota bacterium]
MHEYALADAVVRAALRAADDAGMVAVQAVHVRVGELQQIKQELFEFALAESRPDDEPRLADTAFHVAVEPAALTCRVCSHTFTMADALGSSSKDDLEAIHFVPELAHAFFGCPSCGSPDFEVSAGRGVTISAVEGVQAEDA